MSPAKILLSWGLMRGTSVIPKSNNSARIESNFAPLKLDESDLEEINNLRSADNGSRMNNPVRHIGFDIYNELQDEPTLAQG